MRRVNRRKGGCTLLELLSDNFPNEPDNLGRMALDRLPGNESGLPCLRTSTSRKHLRLVQTQRLKIKTVLVFD